MSPFASDPGPVVPAPSAVPPWPVEAVHLPGCTLSVRSAPDRHVRGPDVTDDLDPAVMVHGLGGSSLNWTDLMALLVDRLVEVNPDLRSRRREIAWEIILRSI